MGKKPKTLITPNERSSKIDAFIRLFDKIDSDIICFCEYAPYFSLKTDSTLDKRDKTKDAILNRYKNFICSNKEGMNCNAVATKSIPFIDSQIVPYSKREQKRSYIVATIKLDEKLIKIVETHLDVPRFKDFRDEQIKELLTSFDKDDYVIICGDFNVASVVEYDVFKEYGYSLGNHGSFGNITTFPKNNRGTCIDNIICKGGIVKSFQVYNTDLSDHYAISCDVCFNE